MKNTKIDEALCQQVKENLQKKDTQDLINIWKKNDRGEYSDEAFEAVKQLLVDQGEELPLQDEPFTYRVYFLRCSSFGFQGGFCALSFDSKSLRLAGENPRANRTLSFIFSTIQTVLAVPLVLASVGILIQGEIFGAAIGLLITAVIFFPLGLLGDRFEQEIGASVRRRDIQRVITTPKPFKVVIVTKKRDIEMRSLGEGDFGRVSNLVRKHTSDNHMLGGKALGTGEKAWNEIITMYETVLDEAIKAFKANGYPVSNAPAN